MKKNALKPIKSAKPTPKPAKSKPVSIVRRPITPFLDPPTTSELAKSHSKSVLTSHSTAYDQAVEDTILKIGSLSPALAYSNSEKAIEFLTQLQLRPQSPGAIARSLGFTIRELHETYKSYQIALSQLEAAKHIPTITEHTAQDSFSASDLCPACSGLKVLTVPVDLIDHLGPTQPCPQCSGTGLVRKPGDHQSRKLLLEQLGMIKTGNPGVNVIVNNGVPTVEDIVQRMEEMEKNRSAIEI